MIKFKEYKGEILITGRNKTDAAIINWFIFALGIFFFVSEFNLQNGFLEEFLILLCVALFLLILKYFTRFQIRLSKNYITIKKTFLQIPYLTIKWSFDKIQKVNLSTIQFQKNSLILEIENHEGFENDSLLIIKGKSSYEIGDKEEAQQVFKLIENGIKILK